eukprot:gene5348-6822_t
MENIRQKINALPWAELSETLHQKGFALIPQLWDAVECRQCIEKYNNPQGYRKIVNMERYRFGQGEYKYFSYPLPEPVQKLREHLYPHLVPVANAWMQALGQETRFPDTREELWQQCAEHGQLLATPLILRYTQGGYNTMHQDLYGEVFFPLQAVVFLNEPGEEYTGGEFVLTQQNPRAQSQASVLQPKRGDVLLFATQYRPAKGSKGYHRVHLKHG